MKVLVTGNRGYIGTVLTQLLREKSYDIVGFDVDYYNGCELEPFDQSYPQITKDIRDVSLEDVERVDAIIHLAALSNDPLGALSPKLTEEINLYGTLKLAKLAKKAGVNRFVYSSSQSMYGISKIDEELDEDDSDKNPLTAYARTKWEAELGLKRLSTSDFIVTCFRPSTVFGASPKLRCDIVFNNLVACAYTTGKIEVKSDGTPWRPVVHIRDVSQAFIAGLEAPESLVANQSFNVGIMNGNFTVSELAKAAQKSVQGSKLVFTSEHVDSRTYRVSFKKILTTLKDYYKPKWNLERGANELIDFFKKVNFTEKDFLNRKCNRLKQLEYLMKSGELTTELNWK